MKKRRRSGKKGSSSTATVALWSLAPYVMQRRLLALATGSSASGRVELDRMVREKFEAAGEAVSAAGLQILRESLNPANAFKGGDFRQIAAAADRIASESLEPYVRRVRANAKRLGNKNPLSGSGTGRKK